MSKGAESVTAGLLTAGARFLAIAALACGCAECAHGFILSDSDFDPWLTTASATRTGNGRPVTLTWSIVPDGTPTPDDNGILGNSNLVSFLDSNFGGNPAGGDASDLTVRPWFELLQQPFDRWEQLSGIDYVYEPYDDGSELAELDGLLGVRGDIRIGGRDVDGVDNTLAFNYLPDIGDMVLDTSEATFFSNPTNNYRRFRNTIAHELGHGLNLEHVTTTTDLLLMEPSIAVAIDGPQLDEIRAVHFFYGDVHEKSNAGLGNETANLATPLGTLEAGLTTSIGTDANIPSQFVVLPADDFVSVSNLDDTDFYSFSIMQPSLLDALLTPLGGVFSQGSEFGSVSLFDANSRSDLTLAFFDTDGSTPLAVLNETGAGENETLSDLGILPPGEYFARVTGAEDTIQLYQLDLSIEPVELLAADFDYDGNVDHDDLAIWQSSVGVSDAGDATDDGATDGADFLTWQRQLGNAAISISAMQTVPEPGGISLFAGGLLLIALRTRVA